MIEQLSHVTVNPTADNRLVLNFQFDYQIINKAKYLGAKWNKAKKIWWFKDNILNRQLLSHEFPGSIHVPDDSAASVFYDTPQYLMKHQVDALRVARKFKRYGFFYDTGTGKTLIGINIVKMFSIKTLVVCPISIIENAWIDDVRKFEPELSISNLWKAGKSKRKHAGIDYALENNQICVINFESFKKYVPKFLKAGFQCLLIDESSRLKCGTSSISKSLIEFGESIPHVYLFSGTPAPNGLDEYFSQMQILNPALLGRSYYKFEQDWMEPVDYAGFKKAVKPAREQEFLSKIATISSVVRKEDVLDLPERTDNIRSVQLSPKELKAYKDMLKDLSVEISSDLDGNKQNSRQAHTPLSGSNQHSGVYGLEDDMPDESLHTVEAANAAVKTMKLRQLTAGFLIDSENDGKIIEFGTSKFKELFLLLSEIGRKQVIIWTQFRHEAEKIAWGFNQLKSKPTFGICNGSVNQATKQDNIDGFKSGQIQYLIGHEKSIGHGITLTNCNIAIYFSESYSHEGHYQSKDRIYRKGQLNACSYYYLHAENSIDAIVHAALAEKASIENSVFDYIKNSQLSN